MLQAGLAAGFFVVTPLYPARCRLLGGVPQGLIWEPDKEKWVEDSVFTCRQGPEAAGEWSARLEMALDPRLADVWSCLFGLGLEGQVSLEQIGWFLRMAYLHGYQDGLIEPKRGALLSELGLEVPGRAVESRKGVRKR